MQPLVLLLVALAVVALAMVGMAVGVLTRGKCLQGSCGGPSACATCPNAARRRGRAAREPGLTTLRTEPGPGASAELRDARAP